MLGLSYWQGDEGNQLVPIKSQANRISEDQSNIRPQNNDSKPNSVPLLQFANVAPLEKLLFEYR